MSRPSRARCDGALLAWIDIGVPDAARVHRARKAARASRLHAQTRRAVAQDSGRRAHPSAESLTLIEVDRDLLAEWTPLLQRRMKLALSFSGGEVYLTLGTRR